MRKILLAVLILGLGGCAGSGGFIPVPEDVIDAAGVHTVKIAGYTKDASVAKEEAVMRTLRWRDTQYQKAYAESGFELEFAMVNINGASAYLPKKISYREAPKFDQPLPTTPSEHPVWKTSGDIVKTIAKYGMIGWLGSEFAGVMKSGYENVGTHYNGPYQPVSDSYNPTTEMMMPEVAE